MFKICKIKNVQVSLDCKKIVAELSGLIDSMFENVTATVFSELNEIMLKMY